MIAAGGKRTREGEVDAAIIKGENCYNSDLNYMR